MRPTSLLAALQPPDDTYPWQTHNPWTRLTSEVLLSRTRRTVVARVFPKFIETWPTPSTLAAASAEQVWKVIRPTGFQRRSEQLITIGVAVAARGEVPRSRDDLLGLPGVGEYAADAVRILAFNGDRLPLDVNVDRVVSRIAGITMTPSGRSPYRNEALVAASVELIEGTLLQRRAVFTGILELSATTCRPNPLCNVCPLSGACEFAATARGSEMLSGDRGSE